MKTKVLLVFIGLMIGNWANAQITYSEKVTDKWPYMFDEFHQGILYYNSSKASKAMFNIDIANQKFIFFEEDNLIKNVNDAFIIDSLVLDFATFVLHEQSIYEVLEKNSSSALLKRIRIDVNALNETGGGYGTGSATDATTRLTSIDVVTYTNVPYDVVKLEKNKGKIFDLITGYYLLDIEKKSIERANNKSFALTFPNADIKKIMKANKLKINKENDIRTIFKEASK